MATYPILKEWRKNNLKPYQDFAFDRSATVTLKLKNLNRD